MVKVNIVILYTMYQELSKCNNLELVHKCMGSTDLGHLTPGLNKNAAPFSGQPGGWDDRWRFPHC